MQDLQHIAKEAVSCGDVPAEKLVEMKECLEKSRSQKAGSIKSQSVARARMVANTISTVREMVRVLMTHDVVPLITRHS